MKKPKLNPDGSPMFLFGFPVFELTDDMKIPDDLSHGIILQMELNDNSTECVGWDCDRKHYRLPILYPEEGSAG